jgi:hypothetical protein
MNARQAFQANQPSSAELCPLIARQAWDHRRGFNTQGQLDRCSQLFRRIGGQGVLKSHPLFRCMKRSLYETKVGLDDWSVQWLGP